MFDSIVIGSGIAGSVAARELAEKGGQKVLILEKRSHIGGNCYDMMDKHGVLVHQYGPHIFHTSLQHVFDYLSRFTRWRFFDHEVAADVNGRRIPIPFNLNTLHMVYEPEKAVRLEGKLAAAYGMGTRVPILKLRESGDPEVCGLAEYVYQNIFLGYTMKQWGQAPEEIDPQVTGRVPVLVSYDNRYFQDKYQGMPLEGYTRMFERILDHPGIQVRLNADARDFLDIRKNKVLFEGEGFSGSILYTGAVDELLNYRLGSLPYRSLEFQSEYYEMDDYQGRGVINYTVSEAFTRAVEYKHMTGQAVKGTTVVREYPRAFDGGDGQIPYYAIMNDENRQLYERYKSELSGLGNFYLIGRLAEYQYYNIDAMADRALALSERILAGEKGV